jgi:ELWxxDGT repeat protein
MVKDIGPGSSDGQIDYLTVVDNQLFFWANDSIHGDELWKSDGTTAGTGLVKDIEPGTTSGGCCATIVGMGGFAYYPVRTLNATQLWKSDGTTAGTTKVKDLPHDYSYFQPTLYASIGGDLLFFKTYSGTAYGTEPWVSDGTESGTMMLKDICPGSSPANIEYAIDANGTVMFSANDSIHGTELWRTDGTAAGTVLVKDINPGRGGAAPNNLNASNKVVFFRAKDENGIRQVWKTDGSDVGTTLIASSPYANVTDGSELVRVGNKIYFTLNDSIHGDELWVYEFCSPSATIVPVTTCESYTWPVNNITYTESKTDTAWFMTTEGCDSLIILQLTIDTINTTVIVSNSVLSAQATNATYRWLDCDNGYSVISGETSQTFTAPDSGHYAVEITRNGCVDTSDCYTPVHTALDELEAGKKVRVYPNPAKDFIDLNFETPQEQVEVKVMDMVGKVYSIQVLKNTSNGKIDLIGAPGLYCIEITGSDYTTVIKVLKQ